VAWRSGKQSDIARLQRTAIEHFQNNTRQANGRICTAVRHVHKMTYMFTQATAA
jgi:hypothetical protein